MTLGLDVLVLLYLRTVSVILLSLGTMHVF